MCRILAVETGNIAQSSDYLTTTLLPQFSEACASNSWNAPDGSKQKDGWGLYATVPDYLGVLSQLYHVAAELNNEHTSSFDFEYDGPVWRVLYLSLNEIWNELEATTLAEKLPPVSQLLVHARAALRGEELAQNQPYVSEKFAFAANLSFSNKADTQWRNELKLAYPGWRINTKHIGAQRICNLLQAAIDQEKSLEIALEKVNSLLAEKTNLYGFNVVTLTDEGIVALCGDHSQESFEIAQYYTLHQGVVNEANTKLKVVASAPFGQLSLAPMRPGQIANLKQ